VPTRALQYRQKPRHPGFTRMGRSRSCRVSFAPSKFVAYHLSGCNGPQLVMRIERHVGVVAYQYPSSLCSVPCSRLLTMFVFAPSRKSLSTPPASTHIHYQKPQAAFLVPLPFRTLTPSKHPSRFPALLTPLTFPISSTLIETLR